MEIALVESASWYKACSRRKKPTFEDLLDEEGRCDYCREIVAMRRSPRTTQMSNRSGRRR